ncbi:MAG: hypothetical protein AB1742_03110 [bacterium]
MKQESSGRNKRRISFLMPYIDFCFMLIIIFVAMLSIAYFEPLGTTDMQTLREEKIDRREGEHPLRPTGLQEKREGIGIEPGASDVRPLIAPRSPQTGGQGAIRRAPDKKALHPEDAEELKRRLEEKERKLKELEEKLRKRKEGRGDHLYIDLGGE